MDYICKGHHWHPPFTLYPFPFPLPFPHAKMQKRAKKARKRRKRRKRLSARELERAAARVQGQGFLANVCGGFPANAPGDSSTGRSRTTPVPLPHSSHPVARAGSGQDPGRIRGGAGEGAGRGERRGGPRLWRAGGGAGARLPAVRLVLEARQVFRKLRRSRKNASTHM